jgi:hypothetical protein
MNKNIDLELAEIGDKQTDTKWTQVCYTVEVKTEGKPVWRWARNWLGIDRRFHTYAEAAKALNKNYVSKQARRTTASCRSSPPTRSSRTSRPDRTKRREASGRNAAADESDKTREKTMKFQSKTGTWVVLLQGILLLIDEGNWQLTVNVDDNDVADITQFLETIENEGDHDITITGVLDDCTVTYIADTDEIKISETPAIGHAWYVTPDDLHKMLA